MNRFQILNKEGNPVSMKQLDAEAAEFWGKTLDPKRYANPTPEFINKDNLEGDELLTAMMEYNMNQDSNWFDTIGYLIANEGNYTSGWNNVVNNLIGESLCRIVRDFDNKDIVNVVKFKKSEENTISLHEKVEISIFGICLKYYKPYIQLINYWRSKGYRPKQIKE